MGLSAALLLSTLLLPTVIGAVERDPVPLAVIGSTTGDVTPADSAWFAVRIHRGLMRSGGYRIVDAGHATARYRECIGDESQMECTIDAGRAVGAHKVLVWQLNSHSGVRHISAYVVDVVAGTTLGSAWRRCSCDVRDVGRQIGSLLEELDLLTPSTIRKPPLSESRIVSEVIVGTLSGSAGLVAGAAIGGSMASCGRNSKMFCGMGEAIMVGAFGLVLGSSTGVTIVGSAGNETGSWGGAFLGALAGSLVGGVVAIAAESEGLLFLAPLATVAGATTGFNLTRRYDTPEYGDDMAVIDVRGGRIGIGAPGLMFRANPVDGVATRSVDIVRVHF